MIAKAEDDPAPAGRHVTRMTIWDAPHYSDAERDAILASYPEHERDARAKGIPQLGSGRVFPISESAIAVPAFAVPNHWAQLGALDFGWGHPTAAVRLAHDREADCVYVTHCYRVKEQTPVVHTAALKPWGTDHRDEQWLPWAWPHDGLQHDKQSGIALRDAYARQGLRMLDDHACFEDGSTGVEAGIIEMLDRMQTARLKVFSHLGDWFDEFRLYHRKDGLIVKSYDDLMSATRYGVMSLRFAAVRKRRRLARTAKMTFDVYEL